MSGQYEYKIRINGAQGIIYETVVAEKFEIEDEMICFYDEDDEYSYFCSLNNLLDIKIKDLEAEKDIEYDDKSNSVLVEAFKSMLGEEKVVVKTTATTDHLPNVLPKEHE